MARTPYRPPSAAPRVRQLPLPARGERRERNFAPLHLTTSPRGAQAANDDPEEQALSQAMAQAREAGYAEGLAQAQAEHSELLGRLRESLQETTRLHEALVEVYRREMVEVCVTVAGALAGRTLAAEAELAQARIQEAIDRLGEEEALQLTLGPVDAERLADWITHLRETGHEIQVVVDDRLAPGDLRARCDSGSIEHVLGRRIELARAAVLGDPDPEGEV